MEKIFEIFNQVKINIHLLDAIQHVPSYVKSLRTCASRKERPMCLRKYFSSR